MDITWTFHVGMHQGGRFVTMVLGSLLLFGCSLQDRLLYYPDQRVPAEAELAAHGIRFWPTAEGYRGLIGDVPQGKATGTVIVLHGNAATAADRDYYVDPLRRLGYRVILAEYPGYGGRKGKLGEDSFVRDTRETIRLASETFPGPVYLLGESLGAAVAASAVRMDPAQIAGLILFTPWESLEEVAKEQFPWLPVRLLMTDRFDTAANLRAFAGPVAVVAAERDTIIPALHAEKLYRSLTTRKIFFTVPRADHNDWPSFINASTWENIMSFICGDGARRPVSSGSVS